MVGEYKNKKTGKIYVAEMIVTDATNNNKFRNMVLYHQKDAERYETYQRFR